MNDSFGHRRGQFREELRKVLDFDHPYPFRPLQSGTPASVLLLFSLGEVGTAQAIENGIEFLVTRRTERVETHKGQYALPGGMQDPEDADLVMTALRENEEEMGIARDEIEPLGVLPPIWTPTGFQVTPVVALLKKPREEIVVVPNEAEIDLWFWCRLERLAAEGVYRSEERELVIEGRSLRAPVDIFDIDTHRIWGVTGAILRNFVERWRRARG